MPIYQDPDRRLSEAPKIEGLPTSHVNSMRRLSEESMRTEDCDGPIPDPSMDDFPPERGGMANNKEEALCSDRAELIERLKRGESPTWVPNRAVSSYSVSERSVKQQPSGASCSFGL